MRNIQPFKPRIYSEKSNHFYEDGRVMASIEEFDMEGVRSIVIHEWTSKFPGEGHTKQSLQWLRDQGFQNIVANGIGLIEDGIAKEATAYWMHMHSLGLVDVLIDDESNDVTPENRKGKSLRM